jgi:hypothetical protein
MMREQVGDRFVFPSHLDRPHDHLFILRVSLMTPFIDVRITSAPRRHMIRWVCTSNPFYVISAGLFLAGLWVSFDSQSEAGPWGLMTGLAGYTLLLAATACLLVRFGNVWDDVRTVLLLVVLMFLATSVTFDEVLVLNPSQGIACSLWGLLFAVSVSEAVLRGTRLRLPLGFRLPYYLILALFFLYPLALSPLLANPESELLLWGLFGFSPAAGLAFLTLLPAIRRGAKYVQDNGSPWRWPLYPWTLFGLLALAVPARAFLLCWSMHLLEASNQDRLIFGPWFLIPFGLVVAVLLLEIGLVSARRVVLGIALALPLGLVILSLVGHRDDPVYRGFLDLFSTRLGGDPLYLTLVASAGFFAYAVLRRVSLAAEILTVVLAALALVGPDTLGRGEFIVPRREPILAAAILQLALGAWRGQSLRCLLGAFGLVLVTALVLPGIIEDSLLRGVVVFHLAWLAVMILGATFNDAPGRLLRFFGAAMLLPVCLAVLFGDHEVLSRLPGWVVEAYVPVMGVVLASYGWMLHHRVSQGVAVVVQCCWLVVVGCNGYRALRDIVAGLDQIVLSLVVFALAVLVSLGKSGQLSRRLAERR